MNYIAVTNAIQKLQNTNESIKNTEWSDMYFKLG